MALAEVPRSAVPAVSLPQDHINGITNQQRGCLGRDPAMTNGEGIFKLATSFKQTPRFSLEMVPGSLPHSSIPPDVDLSEAGSWAIAQMSQVRAEIFAEECLWRDLYAFTGLPRTFFGVKQIMTAWNDLIGVHRPSNFALIPGTAKVIRLGPENAWVTLRYTFKTSGELATSCSGQIGLIPGAESSWKIWHLSTILEHFEGYPSPDQFPEAAPSNSRSSVRDPSLYECCVIGAGFAGLCLSARLKALGVTYVTLEKNARVGDNWSDFPLDRMFDDKDPYFLNVKHLARGYEHYAQKHDLNIWTNSSLKRAVYSPDKKVWVLTVSKKSGDVEVRTKHFVLAIGGAGQSPVMPVVPGRDQFKGIVMHSAEYVSSDEWRGKRGIVVGTANTGHDIAEDMLKAGLSSLTMVQRGRTDVFAVEVHRQFADRQYSRNIPMEESDRGVMGYPNSIVRQMQLLAHKLHHIQEPDRYDGLEKAGFKAGLHGDLWNILCGRQGGHVVDVGTSKKIADGLIKVKNGSLTRFTPSGLEFQDGTTLDGDVVIFCTGFANDVRSQAANFVGPEIAELLEDYFHVDDEGEILGAWKPQGHPGIWYTGGGVHFGRFFSRFIALQIQADSLRKPLRTYTAKLDRAVRH